MRDEQMMIMSLVFLVLCWFASILVLNGAE